MSSRRTFLWPGVGAVAILACLGALIVLRPGPGQRPGPGASPKMGTPLAEPRAAEDPASSEVPAPAGSPEGPGEASTSPGEGAIVLRAGSGSSGLPLPGLELSLILRSSSRAQALRKTTDDHGELEITGLDRCPWSLQVKASGYLPFEVAVDLSGEPARREILVRLSAGESISGVVVGSTGEPIAGAAVKAFLESASVPETLATRSNESGQFQMTGLPAGSWRVLAYLEGKRRTSTRVEVPGGGPLRLTLTDDPGFEILAADASGTPVAGARALVVSRTWGLRPAGSSASTDARGRAKLAGLPDDPTSRIAIEVRARGFLTQRRSFSGAELEAGPAQFSLSRGLEVRGRVVDPGGVPVGGAEVRLAAGDNEATRSLKTTSAGEILFREVPPGKCVLQATTALLGSSEPLTLDLAEGAAPPPATLVLNASGGRLGGKVVDADERPAPLCPVVLRAGDWSLRTVTDENGAFRFEGFKTPEGDGTLEVTAGGGKASVDRRQVSGNDATVLLRAPRRGGLVGLVGGIGDAEFEVRVRPTGSAEPARSFRFGARTGWFRVKGLDPGKYDVELLVHGEPLDRLEAVEVRPGVETGPLRLEISGGSGE